MKGKILIFNGGVCIKNDMIMFFFLFLIMKYCKYDEIN